MDVRDVVLMGKAVCRWRAGTESTILEFYLGEAESLRGWDVDTVGTWVLGMEPLKTPSVSPSSTRTSPHLSPLTCKYVSAMFGLTLEHCQAQ